MRTAGEAARAQVYWFQFMRRAIENAGMSGDAVWLGRLAHRLAVQVEAELSYDPPPEPEPHTGDLGLLS